MRRPIIYHYTAAALLPEIIATGEILPTRQSLGYDRGDIDLTWLSKARFWEPASRAGADLEPEWLRDGGHAPAAFVPDGAARILVRSDRVRPWDDAMLDAGADPLELFRLAQLGLEVEAAPNNWYVVSAPIPASEWLGLQVWSDEWVPVESTEILHGNTQSSMGGRRI
jgi:hypothetical protein